MPATPIVLGPGEGRGAANPIGGPLVFKVRAEQSGDALTLFENEVPPHSGPPLHVHDQQDEAWWILDGRVRFLLGAEESVVGAGGFVWVPRGVPHAFRNDAESAARMLVLFTPGGMEPFFDGMTELGEVRPEDFARLGAAVGMTVVGPPLPAPG